MSMLTAGFKKVRKALHLPPVTLKNVATKYAPVALGVGGIAGVGPLAGIASKVGAVASKIPGAAAVGKVYNTINGKPGTTNIGGYDVPSGDFNYSDIADKISGNAGGAIDKITGVVHDIRKASGAKPITLKNTLSGVGKAAGGLIKGALDHPIETIGGIAAAKSGADAFKRAGDYSKKAVGTAEQSYAERAPLRKLGVAGMQKPTALPVQDYSNAANPFARKRKVSL